MNKFFTLCGFAFQLLLLLALTLCFGQAVFMKDPSALTKFVTFYGAGYFLFVILHRAGCYLDILQERPPR